MSCSTGCGSCAGRPDAADIVPALIQAGFDPLSLSDVPGTLRALAPSGADYSVEFAEPVISEVKNEVVCKDNEVPRVVEILRQTGRASRASGRIYVKNIEQVVRLDG